MHKSIPFYGTKYAERPFLFVNFLSASVIILHIDLYHKTKQEFNIDFNIKHKDWNGLNCKCQGNIFRNNNTPTHEPTNTEKGTSYHRQQNIGQNIKIDHCWLADHNNNHLSFIHFHYFTFTKMVDQARFDLGRTHYHYYPLLPNRELFECLALLYFHLSSLVQLSPFISFPFNSIYWQQKRPIIFPKKIVEWI